MKRIILAGLFFLLTNAAYGGDPFDCSYCAHRSKADPAPSVKEYKDCGTMADGQVVISKKHLKLMAFDDYGLATIFAKGQHFYVKRNGSVLAVITFDNWADDYSEGLVRSRVDGKITYHDRSFKQVIAPKYDWGFPFRNGVALVCNGCKLGMPDGEGHTSVIGGVWGSIDRKGREVVPVRFTREEAEEKQARH